MSKMIVTGPHLRWVGMGGGGLVVNYRCLYVKPSGIRQHLHNAWQRFIN